MPPRGAALLRLELTFPRPTEATSLRASALTRDTGSSSFHYERRIYTASIDVFRSDHMLKTYASIETDLFYFSHSAEYLYDKKFEIRLLFEKLEFV